MNWRKYGFTQRKPKEPGVYFVAGDLLKPLAPPESLRQGWDVARVMFWAGSYTNAHDNRESAAHWRITTLDGVDYAWKPGMWLKGPISPLQPNTELSRVAAGHKPRSSHEEHGGCAQCGYPEWEPWHRREPKEHQ